MMLTSIGEQIVAITRVYSGDKWCKVILEDGTVEWVRTVDILEEEVA